MQTIWQLALQTIVASISVSHGKGLNNKRPPQNYNEKEFTLKSLSQHYRELSYNIREKNSLFFLFLWLYNMISISVKETTRPKFSFVEKKEKVLKHPQKKKHSPCYTNINYFRNTNNMQKLHHEQSLGKDLEWPWLDTLDFMIFAICVCIFLQTFSNSITLHCIPCKCALSFSLSDITSSFPA